MGPRMLPIRKALPYSDDTCPRCDVGASRTSRPMAETVNITEPMPPSPRNRSSVQYVSAMPHSADDVATISSPTR